VSPGEAVETWSSNFAFYLSVAGAAVGLGTPALGRAMLVLLRFVCPIAIVAVLAGAL
jgi:SNF family Na+-dependent transporter